MGKTSKYESTIRTSENEDSFWLDGPKLNLRFTKRSFIVVICVFSQKVKVDPGAMDFVKQIYHNKEISFEYGEFQSHSVS